jgi:hypothetical protein
VNLIDTVRSGLISGCVALLVVVSSGGEEAVHAAADTSLAASSPGQLFGVDPVQQGSTTLPGGTSILPSFQGRAFPTGSSWRTSLIILADARPVATLTSQSLALPFSSEIPILMLVGLALASVGILLFAAWRVRRGIRRRSRTSARDAFARRLSGVE